jgi:hypothetical protein
MDNIIEQFDKYLKSNASEVKFIYCGIMTSPVELEWLAHQYKTDVTLPDENITPDIFPVILETMNDKFSGEEIKIYQIFTKKAVRETMNNVVNILHFRFGVKE